jgi:hypothetical protein
MILTAIKLVYQPDVRGNFVELGHVISDSHKLDGQLGSSLIWNLSIFGDLEPLYWHFISLLTMGITLNKIKFFFIYAYTGKFIESGPHYLLA